MDTPYLLLKAMDIHIYAGYLSLASARSKQVPQTKAHQCKPREKYLEKVAPQNSIDPLHRYFCHIGSIRRLAKYPCSKSP